MKSFYSHPDRLSGIVLMVLASVAVFEAYQLPFGSIRAPDAGFFPMSLSSMLLFFALGIFVNSFISKSEAAEFDSRSWYVVIAAASFVIYALVLSKVGFVLATTVIMLLVMRVLGGMTWIRAIAITIPSVLLSYLGFVELGVPLPRGPLPF